MTITPQLKALMEEKEKAEEDKAFRDALIAASARKSNFRMERILANIDAATPQLDAQYDGKGWKPSTMVKIRYFVIATRDDERAEYRAAKFVRDRLDAIT